MNEGVEVGSVSVNGKGVESKHYQTFEELRQQSKDKAEFWYARDLQLALDYSSWDKFKSVIQKAMIACENSRQSVSNHFSHLGKMVELGSGASTSIL